MTTRNDHVFSCFQCGQCMAVCPACAVEVEGLNYNSDFFELPNAAESKELFSNLIKTRRSVRNFQKKAVQEEHLTKIVEAISLAPPGFPPLRYELTVINDADLMTECIPLMIEFYEKLVKQMKNPVIRFFIKNSVGNQAFLTMKQHLIPLLKIRLPDLKNGNENTLTRDAPAMILFHQNRNEEDLTEDILIAATFGVLSAHSWGLGGSIMSIIPPAVDRSPELRKLFKIPEQNKVVSSLIMGYPNIKYQRGIKREIKKIIRL